ncbi:MAG: dual specificity protein phosphatase [Chlamydiae bacterium]|nr:dual specificity protein phosphatase [Chlamydiota bacterium]
MNSISGVLRETYSNLPPVNINEALQNAVSLVKIVASRAFEALKFLMGSIHQLFLSASNWWMKEVSPAAPIIPNQMLSKDPPVELVPAERLSGEQAQMFRDRVVELRTEVLAVSRHPLSSFAQSEAIFKRSPEFHQERHRIPYPNVDQIAGNIFLGSKAEFLDNTANYSHIITVTDMTRHGGPITEKGVTQLYYPLQDRPDVSDTGESHLQTLIDNGTLENEVFPVLDQALTGKTNVLVHCEFGKNRSASIVIAYLINRCVVSYEEALHFLRSKRWCVGVHDYTKSKTDKCTRLRQEVEFSHFMQNADVVYHKTLKKYHTTVRDRLLA